MTEFEKVEKLRMRADVSYEEAKKALDEANGDILDAMIALENQGKTVKPENEKYSTNTENVVVCTPLNSNDDKDKKKEETKEKYREVGRKFRAFIDKLFVNYVLLTRKEETIIKLPLWIFALVVLIGIHVVPIIIVISLFFGVRYSFVGRDEMKMANEAAQKAEKIAGDVVSIVKDEYDKL